MRYTILFGYNTGVWYPQMCSTEPYYKNKTRSNVFVY